MQDVSRKSRQELEAMSLAQFTQYAKAVIVPHNCSRGTGIHVEFPYDLRTGADEKNMDCHPLYQWTAFMNNTGTLCHVICPEAELLVRLKFTYPIKHLSREKMLMAITLRVNKWIKI